MAELTRLDCDGQFKPFVYLNGRDDPELVPGARKIPPFGGTFQFSLGPRSNQRLFLLIDPLADSGPDGSDPAVAGRASVRRPAADRASGSDSGFAGQDSGSGSTSKISFVERNQRQPERRQLVSGKNPVPS
jgi:hypothetical protein